MLGLSARAPHAAARLARLVSNSQASCRGQPADRPRRSAWHARHALTISHVENSSASSDLPAQFINKQPISTVMTDQLYAYLLAHTREPQVLQQLRQETAGLSGKQMQVSPEQGQFLGLLAELLGARRALEVGVFTGYSSLAVALALPPDGQLVALDRDERSMEVARRYWKLAGVGHKVDGRVGPGLESMQRLLEEFGPDSFDMAFIDADKRGYAAYYELALQLVRPGGLIALDNVLWYGKVANPEVDDKATLALRELNTELLADQRVSISTVPVGDGMTLCRRRY